MTLTMILTVLCLLATVKLSGAQNFQWSACSRTCGPGTRHQRCRVDDFPACVTRYEDCKLSECPEVNCTNYKLGSSSECCHKENANSCGVVQRVPAFKRIFGGTKSYTGQWPWQVALWKKKKPKKKYACGGALISQRWAVTAAHCFTDAGLTAEDVIVMVGINRLKGKNRGMQRSDVEKYIEHPDYDEWTDDLALLKLKTRFLLSDYVYPICLPNNEEVDQDVICYVSGWGAATEAQRAARKPTNELLHVGLRLLPMGACEESFRGQVSSSGVNERALCAGILDGGKDSCIGDSGGPLVCQRKHSCEWFLAGIVSFGSSVCGAKNSPAIYTKVKAHQTWITDKMLEEGEWQPCSKTCGRGLKFKFEKCAKPNIRDCPKTYAGCNNQECPSLPSCPRRQNFKYKDPSSCCAVPQQATCEGPSHWNVRKNRPDPGQWPWIVAIAKKIASQAYLQCSGVLLNKDWVLTNAHCLQARRIQDLIVILGTTTIKVSAPFVQKIGVAKTLIHEAYSYPKDDIALVKLSRSASLNTYVKPICLPGGEKVKTETRCLIVGFLHPPDPRISPANVTEHSTTTLPTDVCDASYRRLHDNMSEKFDWNQHLCVGQFKSEEIPNKFKCGAYVSGSPLVCQRCASCEWYLAGISELGSPDCSAVPDVYMNIYHYEDWIRRKTSLQKRQHFFSCQ